jgi:hypothetical protein
LEHARWPGAGARWTPCQERRAEQTETSLDLFKISQPASVSPATHQGHSVSPRHHPDVAPSLQGRVTHHWVTLPPLEGEQDTIGRTTVVLQSASLGKQGLGSAGSRRSDPAAGKRNGHDDHGYLCCFLYLDWAGTFHHTQGRPDPSWSMKSPEMRRIVHLRSTGDESRALRHDLGVSYPAWSES